MIRNEHCSVTRYFSVKAVYPPYHSHLPLNPSSETTIPLNTKAIKRPIYPNDDFLQHDACGLHIDLGVIRSTTYERWIYILQTEEYQPSCARLCSSLQPHPPSASNPPTNQCLHSKASHSECFRRWGPILPSSTRKNALALTSKAYHALLNPIPCPDPSLLSRLRPFALRNTAIFPENIHSILPPSRLKLRVLDARSYQDASLRRLAYGSTEFDNFGRSRVLRTTVSTMLINTIASLLDGNFLLEKYYPKRMLLHFDPARHGKPCAATHLGL